ncbi:PREDICTED: hemoglobin subunit epsilon-like, partial [Priapulus caudatus]|uniref:Hemoglobin subunit epsilon-like n=1 Tax=Priapulus caudatus TaxID=37621 RepID=A0ABM1F4U4_PRICU
DLDGDDLRRDPRLKGHGGRFMQVVGAVLENIDNADTAIRPLLFQLGERHAYYDGFKPEYFEQYKKGMMYMCEQNFGDKLTPKLRDLWTKVFNFIIDSVRDGCVEALRHREDDRQYSVARDAQVTRGTI